MKEELRENLNRCIGSEEPETYYMAYIRNKFPVKMNESEVVELPEQAGHGYQ